MVPSPAGKAKRRSYAEALGSPNSSSPAPRISYSFSRWPHAVSFTAGDESASIYIVRITYDACRAHGRAHGRAGTPPPSLEWRDTTTSAWWPYKSSHGTTVAEPLRLFGEEALVRLLGVAAIAAERMAESNRGGGAEFVLEELPTSAEADDRLQLVRAMIYVAWGLATGKLQPDERHPGGYCLCTRYLGRFALRGSFAAMQRTISRSATMEQEVRKFFPRRFLERLAALGEGKVDGLAGPDPACMAPLVARVLQSVTSLLEAPPTEPRAEQEAHKEATNQLLGALFGPTMQRAPRARQRRASGAGSGAGSGAVSSGAGSGESSHGSGRPGSANSCNSSRTDRSDQTVDSWHTALGGESQGSRASSLHGSCHGSCLVSPVRELEMTFPQLTE
jgi:hypothetical protein